MQMCQRSRGANRGRSGFQFQGLSWIVGVMIVTIALIGIRSPVLAAPLDARSLGDRVATYPHWRSRPPVQPVRGDRDLLYPAWMAGTWRVTSTLIDAQAPLAPEIVTPGFASNRDELNRPITFLVRFQPQPSRPVKGRSPLPFGQSLKPVNQAASQPMIQRTRTLASQSVGQSAGQSAGQPVGQSIGRSAGQDRPIVADRAFNGLNIARAYLGEAAVLGVTVPPEDPNRQIVRLRGDRQLLSTVTERASEQPDADTFIATEVARQSFVGAPQVYFNAVETTTVYRRSPRSGADPGMAIVGNQTVGEQIIGEQIIGDQYSAVYLSPRDPDYFAARDRPVALYRYRLQLDPQDNPLGEAPSPNRDP